MGPNARKTPHPIPGARHLEGREAAPAREPRLSPPHGDGARRGNARGTGLSPQVELAAEAPGGVPCRRLILGVYQRRGQTEDGKRNQ